MAVVLVIAATATAPVVGAACRMVLVVMMVLFVGCMRLLVLLWLLRLG